MKIHSFIRERGSVLIIALLTITIMTLICATSLLVTSQNANTGMQVASWQEALTGAETGVDAAIRALNTGSWTLVNASGTTVHWMNVTGTLPTTEPSTGSNAAGAPTSGQYNYLPSSALTVTFPGTSEGPTKVSAWVTLDTAGMSTAQDTNGKQWYRLRSTGKSILTDANGNALALTNRVSNNRMDDDLRNTFSLRFDRKTQLSTNTPGPTRTIEVIMQPLSQGGWARGITLKNWISMSGSGVVDSYDSSNSSKSTNHLYDSTKRQSHGDVGTLNTNGSSDLRSTYVYGNLSYSGTAVKNTTNVQGTISTPFSVSVPATSDPSGLGATWTTYTGGGSNPPNSGSFNGINGSQGTVYIKVNGDLTISSSGNPLHLVQHDNGPIENMVVWVTGKLTTQGSGYINQDSNIKVTWYVGGDITMSGSSYTNGSGYASQDTIIGYGTSNKLTVSGSSDFVGTFNVPGYDTTISGGGSVAGAIIANTLTISGGSGLHYDEALGSGGGSATIGNYAFASWFEDNSDPNRKDGNGNVIVY